MGIGNFFKNLMGGGAEQANKPDAPESIEQNPGGESEGSTKEMGGGAETSPTPDTTQVEADTVASEQASTEAAEAALKDIQADTSTPETPAEEKGPDQPV